MRLAIPRRRICFVALIALSMLMRATAVLAQVQFETLKALATDGSEGSYPRGPVVQTADGWIYGVTTGPDVYRIFRFDPTNVAGTFTVVFDAANLQTGAHAIGDGGLVLAGDGNVYFVDQGKHPNSPCPGASGWVGRLTPPGTVTHVASFCGGEGNPINPYVGLGVGPDGALYGVANLATAASQSGAAIYRVGLDGGLSKVTDFVAMQGFPNALTAGPDGWLYGTTQGATQPSPAGQMYRVHPTTGALETVYEWPANGGNGSRPRGRLLSVPPRAGYDLAFVGVTEDWGDYTCGVVYRLDVLNGTGTLTRLHDFTCGYGGLPDNGNSPQAGLVQHTNGLLYGATGGYPAGRIYRIGPEGGFAAVYNLGNLGATENGDPVVSEAPLLLGADGHLYGTTSYNSAGPPPTLAGGSIFKWMLLPQDPLFVTDAPESQVYGTTFTVVTTGGSGTGSVTFSTSGACTNSNGGSLITMTSGTGICLITATKQGDGAYNSVTSDPVSVTAVKAAQAPLTLMGVPTTAGYNTNFTADAAGGSGTGALTLEVTGVCATPTSTWQVVMTSGAGTCVVTAIKDADDNYEATSISSTIIATKIWQLPLTVTGAPASAPNASVLTLGTSGGSGTGSVTFSVTGACSNTAGGAVITITAESGTCAIVATKQGDANFNAVSSDEVSVLATPEPEVQFETLKALATDGSEGSYPRGPVVQTADGWIYGVTTGPDVYRIFRFDPTNVAGTFTVVFDAANLQTGAHAIGDGGLVLAGDGNVYFVDQGKHPNSPCPGASGWVGRLTPPGTVTHVASFCGGEGNPINPYVGLGVGPDGALYGVANLATAASQSGAAIYRVGLDGGLSKVTDFVAMQGFPNALTAGPDGWLYGTTQGATQPSPAGQMYRVHPTTGALETVYEWPANGGNGSRPRGRLLSVPPRAGYDLAFVGVTEDWGDYTCGVVYRLDVLNGTGMLTRLHDFTCGYGGLPDNGNSPQAGLVQHTNGLLYGATGGYPAGRIYRIGPEGGFAAVYNLGNLGATENGDPVVSEAPLLLGADGHLYGTTSYNSAGPPPTLAGGSIFRLRFGAGAAPTALDDEITTAEDTPTNGTLTAENPGGRPLTFSLVTTGTLGAAVVDTTTGAFTYTPNTNADGADSFTFKVNDGTSDSNIATVSVTITPVNDAPVAMNGILEAVEDTVAQGTFSATDVEGPSLTFSIVANGSRGTAAITNPVTGAFTYTPNANANGADTVTFEATDGSITSNTATVAITIDPQNDAPIAQNGTKSVFTGSTATGTLTASDIDSAALTYSIIANGSKGTAVVTNPATGAYTYTANAGASGTDTFSFKANDGAADSNVATIAVTILANRPPVANNGTLTTAEEKSASSSLNASDPDGNRLTFRIVSNGLKGTATITNTASGRFTYVPAPNANGSDSLTFVASDGTIDSNVATINVTITSVNDAPVAANASYAISSNTTLNSTLVGTDIDSSTLTYAIVKRPRKGSLSLNAATGVFTYTPPAGFVGVESFTYRVSDGAATSATATISITVN